MEGYGGASICGFNQFRQEDSLTSPHLFRPLSTVFLQLCVCARASEAHLVVGLLVQRDRRVIKGALDWLPVKDEGIARRGNSAVVAQTHTHTRAHCAVLVVSDIVFHIPSVSATAHIHKQMFKSHIYWFLFGALDPFHHIKQ